MKVQRKEILKIVLIIIPIVLLFAFFGMGFAVTYGATHLMSNEQTVINRETDMAQLLNDVEDFQSKYTVEQISIPSTFEKHTIPADYMSETGDKNNDTAILVHGLGANRISIYPVAEMFLEMGYNVIAYDQRSAGENLAKYNTYGFRESYDLLDYVDYADSFMDEDKQLVVWGTSFGGATTGIALGRDSSKINRVILDCPLSEARYSIEKVLSEEVPIPLGLLLIPGNIVIKMKLGFSFDDLNVYEWIADTPVPVLIFNSKADDVTPFFMGEDIYNAIRSENKKLVTVPDSGHVRILSDYPELYKQEVANFLQ